MSRDGNFVNRSSLAFIACDFDLSAGHRSDSGHSFGLTPSSRELSGLQIRISWSPLVETCAAKNNRYRKNTPSKPMDHPFAALGRPLDRGTPRKTEKRFRNALHSVVRRAFLP